MAPNVFVLAFYTIFWGAITLPPAIIKSLITSPIDALAKAWLYAQDFGYVILNTITPNLKKGSVIPKGMPGYGGIWPEYIAPTEHDSRAPCPGLNAMANHGILPRDGRNITMYALGQGMQHTFNFSPSLVKETVDSVRGIFNRDYFALEDLNCHNLVEHDASILRHDALFAPDQRPPAKDLISKFISSATGPVTKEHPEGQTTIADVARFLSIRRAQSKRDNPSYSLNILHKFFAASNATLLYEVWGKGDVATMKKSLYDERLYDGFEPANTQRFGFTTLEFHLRGFEIWFRTRDDIKL